MLTLKAPKSADLSSIDCECLYQIECQPCDCNHVIQVWTEVQTDQHCHPQRYTASIVLCVSHTDGQLIQNSNDDAEITASSSLVMGCGSSSRLGFSFISLLSWNQVIKASRVAIMAGSSSAAVRVAGSHLTELLGGYIEEGA